MVAIVSAIAREAYSAPARRSIRARRGAVESPALSPRSSSRHHPFSATPGGARKRRPTLATSTSRSRLPRSASWTLRCSCRIPDGSRAPARRLRPRSRASDAPVRRFPAGSTGCGTCIHEDRRSERSNNAAHDTQAATTSSSLTWCTRPAFRKRRPHGSNTRGRGRAARGDDSAWPGADRRPRIVWVRDDRPIVQATDAVHLSRRRRTTASRRRISSCIGMPGHAVFMRRDRSVFAHVHPSGSAPMAALDLAMPRNTSHPAAPSGRPRRCRSPTDFPNRAITGSSCRVKRAGAMITGAFDADVK